MQSMMALLIQNTRNQPAAPTLAMRAGHTNPGRTQPDSLLSQPVAAAVQGASSAAPAYPQASAQPQTIAQPQASVPSPVKTALAAPTAPVITPVAVPVAMTAANSPEPRREDRFTFSGAPAGAELINETARQLEFRIHNDERLSAAVQRFVEKEGYQLDWESGAGDFVIPVGFRITDAGMQPVLRRVLNHFGMSFHIRRGNKVVAVNRG
jgi:hypothetical protein